MKYLLQNIETGNIHVWSIPTILREINRDRSNEWRSYNKRDWKEGLAEVTEYRIICTSTGNTRLDKAMIGLKLEALNIQEQHAKHGCATCYKQLQSLHLIKEVKG